MIKGKIIQIIYVPGIVAVYEIYKDEEFKNVFPCIIALTDEGEITCLEMDKHGKFEEPKETTNSLFMKFDFKQGKP